MWPANDPLRMAGPVAPPIAGSPESNASSTAPSTSSSDTDSSGDDWKAVSIDFLLTNKIINEVAQQKKINLPATVPSPTHPAPTKLELYGEFTFVQFVPEWTHPDWNENTVTVVGESGDHKKVANKDPSRKIRPAVLARDVPKNPTPYAVRWGMHPDRVDGRSLLSPTNSSTRRIGLSQPIKMRNNELKHFVTGQDLPSDIDNEAHAGGVSVLDYLAQLGPISANPKLLDPLLALYNSSENDKDFQRLQFLGLTTDEKIAYGVHTVDDDLGQVPYDLSGPLHTLVSRRRWLSTVDRGGTEEEPRYLYNVFGRRGEYTVDDDFLWLAMQPALQLVTRALNCDHPAWRAITSVLSRRPIRTDRNPFGASGSRLVSIWEHLMVPELPAEAKKLEDAGFDINEAVASFLEERLELTIASAYSQPADTDTFWGITQFVNWDNHTTMSIRVAICAEMLWPLLVPTYNDAEKGAASLMVASTIIHELAHAVNFAIRYLIRFPRRNADRLDQLRGWDDTVIQALETIHTQLVNDGENDEPFWENEPRAELGYVIENQLWGGPINSLIDNLGEHNSNLELLPYELGMDKWPNSNPNPHKANFSFLTHPPLPVDSLITPMPVKSFSKLFTTHFWDCDFRKYGHHALKLTPDRPVPTLLNRQYKRVKEYKRVFGRGEGHWLYLALMKIRFVGNSSLYLYLRELVNDRLEEVWVRKRYHHECKLWPHRNSQLNKLLAKAEARSEELARLFKLVNTTSNEKFAAIQEYNERVLGSRPGRLQWSEVAMSKHQYLESLLRNLQLAFTELIKAYERIHHHLLTELEYTQSLVVDYVKQTPSSREMLYDRYGYYLYENITNCFEHTLDESMMHLDDLKKLFDATGSLTPEIAADIDRVRTTLQIDRNHFAETKIYLEKDYIGRVEDGWRGKFATVVSGRQRNRTAMMEKLAYKDMMQAEEPIKEVVRHIGVILDRHKSVFAVGKAQDEDLAAKMEKDLKVNRERCIKAAGAPGWRGLTTNILGPNENSMGDAVPRYPNYAMPTPMSTDVPPWTPAASAGPSRISTPSHPAIRNLAFGVPSVLEPTPPATPPPGASTMAFAQYANTSNPFGAQQGSSVLASGGGTLPQLPQSGTGIGVGGSTTPANAWRPFGDAYSITATLSDDLRRSNIQTPEIQGVFGAEAFVREQAQMKAELAARAAAGTADSAEMSWEPHNL